MRKVGRISASDGMSYVNGGFRELITYNGIVVKEDTGKGRPMLGCGSGVNWDNESGDMEVVG